MRSSAHTRLRAYFAAPLFNEMERSYNVAVVAQLEEYLDVFLPQRDGGLLMNYVKGGVSPDRAASLIFESDRAAMESSSLLIALLDGSTIDEGVAFETGYMFALGRPCVGLQTDMRRALPTGNNPMICCSMSVVFQSVSELVGWAREVSELPAPRESLGMPRSWPQMSRTGE